MFFDCSALLLGLVAAVVARWSPNDRYTYGYVRADTLAGFVNAIFLVFIAFFILSEALEVSLSTSTITCKPTHIVSKPNAPKVVRALF